MNDPDFITLLTQLFPDAPPPKPLHLLWGQALLDSGLEIPEVASKAGTTQARLSAVRSSSRPVEQVLGLSVDEISADTRKRSSQILGTLMLGRCAETAFEDIYRSEMHSEELELRDLREGRSDTDYRLYNGAGRPIYRINIKFHGAVFRKAKENVGLEPEDCFPLATYKIYQALQKQERDELPYLFAIVGDRGISGASVGELLPSDLTALMCWVHASKKATGKRTVEDAVVGHLAGRLHNSFTAPLARIRAADWHVLSARRANKLLRQLLFERVIALKVPRFVRAFPGAEVDMHFSISQDLTPLRTFLTTLRDAGSQKVITLLERGEY